MNSKILFFVFSSIFFVNPPSYSTNRLAEQELFEHQLSKVQLEYLDAKIKANQKQHLNQTFSENELMVDLMPPSMLGTRIFRNSCGEIETRYMVDENWYCTLKQYEFGICPLMDTIKKERPKRLDGKGYAKENSDGSITVGRFNIKDLKPVSNSGLLTCSLTSLKQEVKTDLEIAQKQRRPEGLRDKDFTHRTKVEVKPTPEDLEKIEQSQRDKRSDQLEKLKEQFQQLPIHLLEGDESQTTVKTIEKGFELLSKNIANESAFNIFFKNVQEKYVQLKNETTKAVKNLHAQQTSLDTPPVFSLGGEKNVQKEAKEQAQLQIAAQERKEQLHENRPNANPTPTTENDQEDIEPQEENAAVYVFSTCSKHAIIEDLKQTATDDSSYAGIKISRERLRNFVQFLRDEEKGQRSKAGEQLQHGDDLGYDYDPAQGKGSHLKVRFGRGIKPIILSREGGNFLTVNQLRDLKNALIQKGLIPL